MKPILFNTDMVRAILEGRKTVTRRVIKPQPEYCTMSMAGLVVSEKPIEISDGIIEASNAEVRKPPFETRDILYVRETWAEANGQYLYRADVDKRGSAAYYLEAHAGEAYNCGVRWRPSIHMPKEAARLFLLVTDVRVKRLQDITEDGARSEGCYHGPFLDGCDDFMVPALYSFQSVWDSTVRKTNRDTYGWDANPWVWVIEFERISKEAALEVQKGGAG